MNNLLETITENYMNALLFLVGMIVSYLLISLLIYGITWAFDLEFKWSYTIGFICVAILLKIIKR